MSEVNQIRKIVGELSISVRAGEDMQDEFSEINEYLDTIEEDFKDLEHEKETLQKEFEGSEERVAELEKESLAQELTSFIATPLGRIYYNADNIFSQELMSKLSEIIYDKTEAGALEILERVQLTTRTLP